MKKLFGQRLKELRTKKGLVQEAVAEYIGITTENYSRLENGLSFPKPKNLVKIAKVFGVEIFELFQFSMVDDYENIQKAIINKLTVDKETTYLTYKFLKSLGKI